MFGTKKPNAPRPLNDSGRSLISETFSLEGTLRTSGAIDIAGLDKGEVYTNNLYIKETGSVIGPVETDKIPPTKIIFLPYFDIKIEHGNVKSMVIINCKLSGNVDNHP